MVSLARIILLLISAIAVIAPVHAQDLVGGKWQSDADFTSATHAMGAGSFGIVDINSDGMGDFAHHDIPSGFLNLFDGQTGALIRSLDFNGHPGIWCTVSQAGDVNNDGTMDFFARKLGYTSPLVVASGIDGSALITIPEPGPEFDGYSYVQKPAGDIDGDGFGDIMVSSDHAAFSFPTAGTVLIYSGQNGSLIHQIDGAFVGATLGSNLAATGDQNGDGYDDFLVASSGYSGIWHGAISLYSGATGNVLWTLPNPAQSLGFGYFTLEWIGDFNQDGFGDFMANNHSDCIVFSGATGRELRRYQSPYMTSLGDLDQDGVIDFLADLWVPEIGAPHSIISGKNGLIMAEFPTDFPETTTVSFMDSAPGQKPQLLLGQFDFSQAGAHVELRSFSPYLIADTDTLSVSAGGTVVLNLDFGASHGTHPYQCLASFAGMGPSVIGFVEVPLSWDRLMTRTWQGSYSLPSQGLVGTLDLNGRATCGFRLNANAYPALVGRTLSLATVALQGGIVRESSVAIEIELIP